MNDFERKLRDTPLRQPPADWREEILNSLPVADAKGAKRSAPDTSPQRLFRSREEAQSPRTKRPLLAFLTKPATIFCLFIGTVVTGGAALLVGVGSASSSAWERYAEEARARGVKMSLQELIPAPVPDAENFATVPLFANLFSDDEEVRKKATSALDLGSSKSGKALPFASMSTGNLCDLKAWQAHFVQMGNLTAASSDPAADVLQAIENRLGPALAELAEAERRPHSVFPVKWELGLTVLLPHLQVLKSAGKVHSLRLSAHLAQRNTAAAYDELRGILRLARALEHEPVLICGLVRVMIVRLAVDGAWEGVVKSAWDRETLEKIEREFATLDLLSSALFAFHSERAAMNDLLDSARAGTEPYLLATMGDPAWQMMLRAVPKIPGLISVNQMAINRSFDQFDARIDPAAVRFHDTGPTDADIREIDESMLKQHIYVFYRRAVPAFNEVETRFLQAHAMVQLGALACALERFRLSTGVFPDSLDALAPAYVSVLPHDVITGEPLHYRRTEDGKFLLYSVGKNGVDDGGAVGLRKDSPENSTHLQLDWAWRWPQP